MKNPRFIWNFRVYIQLTLYKSVYKCLKEHHFVLQLFWSTEIKSGGIYDKN